MGITTSNPPFSAAVFQMVYGAQPVLVGSSPSFYDFTTPLQVLPSGVTLTRASAGYRYNSSGLLVSEATDVARFQYAPVGLTARGLLVEDTATNNFQYSQELDNAYWTKSQATITANAAVAPDGTTTMDKLVDNATLNIHQLRRSVSFVSGTTYSLEFFAKAGGVSYIAPVLLAAAFGSDTGNYFNLSTGALGTMYGTCTPFIQDIGGGIYYCTILATATATTSTTVDFRLSKDGLTSLYTGTGTDGILLWGLQVKEISCSTSYIPTTSAAATRAADVSLITNAYALADQVWVVRGRTPRKSSGGAVNVAMQVDDGTSNNRRTLRYGTDGKLHVIATVGGVDQCDLDLGAVANDTDFTVACRFADNKFAASLNGGAIVTDLSGANPLGLTTARIGRSSAGNYWNSTIRTIETRRTATDAELPLLAA